MWPDVAEACCCGSRPGRVVSPPLSGRPVWSWPPSASARSWGSSTRASCRSRCPPSAATCTPATGQTEWVALTYLLTLVSLVAPVGQPRRHDRPQAALHLRFRRLRAGVTGVRPGAEPGHAGRRSASCRPSARPCCRPTAWRLIACAVPRRVLGQGRRCAGRRAGRRPRARSGRGRPAAAAGQLAAVVPAHRASGRHRRRHRLVLPATQPESRGTATRRLARSGPVRARDRNADDRPVTGNVAGTDRVRRVRRAVRLHARRADAPLLEPRVCSGARTSAPAWAPACCPTRPCSACCSPPHSRWHRHITWPAATPASC